MNQEKVDKIIDRYSAKEGKGILIQLLLDIQNEFNWLPGEAIVQISERLQVPVSQIYRIASFYKVMSLAPIGRHLIQVCLGTACHVRGGPKILDKVEECLKIKTDETTSDMKFTVRRVNCLGCCALGPVMVVDNDYHGKITTVKVKEILESYD
ncbi:MAG: NAD(P)H-dependent oxidoreductase subunit E [Methanophagales archaeon]|nr:NAD(P)H-dependent oxidoreductase subunit E [Methanophagales archaeon]